MTFLMHWSFKTGYHEIAAKKSRALMATGAPFGRGESCVQVMEALARTGSVLLLHSRRQTTPMLSSMSFLRA